MQKNEKNMMKIVYLFMSVNGRVTDSQMQKFKEIGAGLDTTFNSELGSIVGDCEQILVAVDISTRSQEVKDAIIAIASERISQGLFSTKGFTPTDQRRLLWSLVNLYHGGEDSLQHKRIIVACSNLWGMSSLLDEMHDTALTFIALEEYKQWLKTVEKDVVDFERVKSGIEKNWQDTNESISTLITLG